MTPGSCGRTFPQSASTRTWSGFSTSGSAQFRSDGALACFQFPSFHRSTSGTDTAGVTSRIAFLERECGGRVAAFGGNSRIKADGPQSALATRVRAGYHRSGRAMLDTQDSTPPERTYRNHLDIVAEHYR